MKFIIEFLKYILIFSGGITLFEFIINTIEKYECFDKKLMKKSLIVFAINAIILFAIYIIDTKFIKLI